MNDEVEVKKVNVFAAYMLGTGPDAKMVGDESKNRFKVTLAPTSKMLQEIEQQLAERHAEEVAKGLVPIVHHFQLISF
ncbi:MAG: hypothetical protein M0P64_00900 [Candidatus Pacebacteria bacterium]|jgi:hypothetical protein|nr:hypothetical protein [Candidatus Paceibacterota bacterium]